MVQRQTFGRRPDPRSPAPLAKPLQRTETYDSAFAASEPTSAVLPPADWLSVDPELQAWKSARIRKFEIPWRQLSLMAGLCFGIASLVLPNSINEIMQWPLYALTGASFYAGLRKKKNADPNRKPDETAAPKNQGR